MMISLKNSDPCWKLCLRNCVPDTCCIQVMANPRAEEVKQRISAIWENLLCPICLDLMSTPVTTKCDHQFCKFCMQKLLDRSRCQEANCPVCKTKVTKRSLQESSAFQTLVAGLQKLVEAYEFDTCTNYFTGLAQVRRPVSDEVWQLSEKCVDVETPEHDGIHQADKSATSMTSSQAAKKAFAQLMDLGDSCSATLDSGLGHLPQALNAETLCSPGQRDEDLPLTAEKDEALCSDGDSLPLLVERGHDMSMAQGQEDEAGPTPSSTAQRPALTEQEEEERGVVHAQRHTQSSRRLVAEQHSADEEEEEVVLRRSSRSARRRSLAVGGEPENQKQSPEKKSSGLERRRGLDAERIIDVRHRRSLEKVSEWLLRIPPEGPMDDEQEKQQQHDSQSEEEHSFRGNNSSCPTGILANQMTDKPANLKEEGRRALEEQVFGAVYSRGRRTGRGWRGIRRREADQHPPDMGSAETLAAPEPGATSDNPELQAPRGRARPGRKRQSGGSLTPADFIKRSCVVDDQEQRASEGPAEPEPHEEESAKEGLAKSEPVSEPQEVNCVSQSPDEQRQAGSAGMPGLNTCRGIPGEANPVPDLGLAPEEVPEPDLGLAPVEVPEPDIGLAPEEILVVVRGQECSKNGSVEKDGERYLDGSASEVNVSTRGQKRGRMKGKDTWTDANKPLSSDLPGSASRLRDARGRRAQRDYKKQPKTGRALTLIGTGEGLCPQVTHVIQPPGGNTEVQIDNYPSSEEALTLIAQTRRRTKKLVDFTTEVQGISRRTRSMSAKVPPAELTHTHSEVQDPRDHTHTHTHTQVQDPQDQTHTHPEGQDPPMKARTSTVPIECHLHQEHSAEEREQTHETGASHSPRNQSGLAQRRNGCVCEQEMDSIEEMEVVEASASNESKDALSAAVVPHTQTPQPHPKLPPLVTALQNSGSLLDAVVPQSRGPVEAVGPFFPSGISSQCSPAPLQDPGSPALPQVFPATVSGAPTMVFQQTSLENCSAELESPCEVLENDSELDTELLLKSFKCSKRRSFHLGSPNCQPESLAEIGAPANTPTKRRPGAGGVLEAEPNVGLFGLEPNQAQDCEAAPAVLSSNSDLVPPSDPGQDQPTALLLQEGYLGSGSLVSASQELCEMGSKGGSGDNRPNWRRPNPVLSAEGASDSQDFVLLPNQKPLKQQQQPTPAQTGSPAAGRGTSTPALSLPDPQDASEQQGQSCEWSMTPDGLAPLEGFIPQHSESRVCAVSVSGEREAEAGTDMSQPLSSVRSRGKRRKAQRLESSESELSSEDEELPSLQQIFRPLQPISDREASLQPISNQDQGSLKPLGPAQTPENPEGEESDCEVIPCSLETPPPKRLLEAGRKEQEEGVGHDDNGGHGSQDLFGSPEEDEDVAEAAAGETVEFSQYSSDIITTQQKVEMQAELRRLEQMMALVSEALKQKEAEAGPKAVGGASSGVQEMRPKSWSLTSPKPCMWDEGSVGTDETGLPDPPPDGLRPTQPCNTQRHTQGRRCTRRSGCHDNSLKTEVRVEVSPVAAPTKPRPLQLVLSGLSGSQQVEVKRFSKKMGGSVTSQVTSSTTHVIIRTDDELVCERTLKYFQGIANRTWVISHLWVSECLRHDKLINEAEFEVCGDVVNGRSHRGPQRSRLAQPNNLLMKGMEVCFHGPFTGMTIGQMQEMVELCGGVVVGNLRHFSRKCSSQLVIVQPDQGSETNFRFRGAAVVVTRGWLLDSIATYTLQDPQSYTPGAPLSEH